MRQTRDNPLTRKSYRRGAVAVESAIVLPIVLFVLFASLDLGLAALRYNFLADAARRIGRESVIHGSLAPIEIGSWGPDQYQGNASDSAPIVSGAKNQLPTMESDEVSVTVTWLDNDNAPRNRIQVEVSYLHQPLIPGLFAWGPLNLTSTTTMSIVN